MLKTARWVILILMWLNVIVGVPMVALVPWSIIAEAPFLALFAREIPQGDAPAMLAAGRWVFAIVLPVMILAHLLLRHLLAMLASVAAGDPFIPANARRLQATGWYLLLIQLCDIGFGIAGAAFDVAAGERLSGWSPGLTGWVAVLLVFVLARVFREGTRLRDDAELTI